MNELHLFAAIPTLPDLLLEIQSLLLGILCLILLVFVADLFLSRPRNKKPRVIFFAILAIFWSIFFYHQLGDGRWSLLALTYGVSIAACFMHRSIAISFMIANFMLRPWEMAPHVPALLLLPDLLFRTWAIAWLFSVRSYGHIIVSRIFHPSTLAFFAVMVIFFISAQLSVSPVDSTRRFFMIFLKTGILYLLIILSIFKRKDLMRISLLTAISIVFTGLVSYVYSLTIGADRVVSASKFLGNSNDLAAISVISAGLFLGAMFDSFYKKNYWGAFGGLFPLSVLLWCIHGTQSRGALLAVALMAMVGLMIKRRPSLKQVLFYGSFGGALAVFALKVLVSRNSSEMAESLEHRLNYFFSGIHMAIKNPVTGVGLFQYENVLAHYTLMPLSEGTNRAAHSSWVQILSESGFLGFGVFLVFILMVIYAAWSIRKKYLGVTLAFCGFTFCISFLSHGYTIYPYITYALVIGGFMIKDVPMEHKKPLVI